MIRIAIAMLLLPGAETADLAGLVVEMGESPSERLNPSALYAPGAPPVLSFRYFDASDRGRFGNLGLMTDDAGH
jgi:hypothetical protein